MRLVARVAGWILLVVMATAALVLVVPILRGEPSRLLIVSGHSMDPTFHTGDLVLAWPGSGYEVGDIAPYRVPEGEPGAGGLVIHRIIGGDGTAGFVMQGDNNPTPDIWMPRNEDIIGRQVLLVPRVGELMAWVRQPAVLAALIAGLVTAAAVSGGLSRARRPHRRRDRPDRADHRPEGRRRTAPRGAHRGRTRVVDGQPTLIEPADGAVSASAVSQASSTARVERTESSNAASVAGPGGNSSSSRVRLSSSSSFAPRVPLMERSVCAVRRSSSASPDATASSTERSRCSSSRRNVWTIDRTGATEPS